VPRARLGSLPWTLAVALGSLVAAGLLIDPRRNTAFDDDWAYALTVERLLETGAYRLHDWAAANPAAQVCWGVVFSKLFGFSHATLRLSTFVLSILAVLTLYALAREEGLRPRIAGLLALGLAGSPLFLRLSFSFMTDVPFLAFVLGALWLYPRGLEREDLGLVLAGSLLAACATLTRQFGVALLGAWILLFLADRHRGRRAHLYAAGSIAPAVAAWWQGLAWSRFPNWTAGLRGAHEIHYLENPGLFLRSLFYRPAVVLLYLGLFTLPLALVALGPVLRQGAWRARARRAGAAAALLTLLAAGIALRPGASDHPFLLPLIPWNLGGLLGAAPGLRTAVTAASAVSGVLLLGLAIARWRRVGEPPERRFLDLAALAFLGIHIACAQFGDEYLLVFLPLALVLLGRVFEEHERVVPGAALLGVLALVLGASWTRGALAQREAQWEAGDLALSLGAPPERISASWEWDCFHGAFDAYVDDLRGTRAESRLDDGYEGLEDFFARYLGARSAAAEYVVTSGPPGRPCPPGVEAVGAPIGYRDGLMRERTVVLGRRLTRRGRARS
jgi:4-amino-4-deoxy-L-arabinose transferase-like glycosyltransferase